MCSYGHLHLQNVNDMVSYVLQPNLRKNITSFVLLTLLCVLPPLLT